jgi:hypothetical protein
MNDKQILFAIENYPDSLMDSIYVICDIYCIDESRAFSIVQNEHGPLYDSSVIHLK